MRKSLGVKLFLHQHQCSTLGEKRINKKVNPKKHFIKLRSPRKLGVKWHKEPQHLLAECLFSIYKPLCSSSSTTKQNKIIFMYYSWIYMHYINAYGRKRMRIMGDTSRWWGMMKPYIRLFLVKHVPVWTS